jgi:protein-tyrosine phosphatase
MEDKVFVSVISILLGPGQIGLVTKSLEEQRQLQNDTTNHAKDNHSHRINMDINNTVIPLRDGKDSDLSTMLPEALAAIDEALGMNITPSSPINNDFLPNEQRICLVHCAMGASRSVSVIVAYLLSQYSHTLSTFDEALQHV